MLNTIARILFWAIASAVALFVLAVFVPIGWMFWGKFVDDPRYAGDFFGDLVEYDEVIASRYWGTFGVWSCTYAIVRLADAPPPYPNSRPGAERGWRYAWGGDWQPTPAHTLGDTTRDALGACADEWDVGIYEELQASLDQEGAFYTRDGVDETVMIYAPSRQIAALVRFGD
ncbi:MAG: hypothetical protein AAFY14_03805 [Pseudomonadota bacterium]